MRGSRGRILRKGFGGRRVSWPDSLAESWGLAHHLYSCRRFDNEPVLTIHSVAVAEPAVLPSKNPVVIAGQIHEPILSSTESRGTLGKLEHWRSIHDYVTTSGCRDL